MKKNKLSLRTKDALLGGAFMTPWLIGLLVFILFPQQKAVQ